jgi:inosine-uridine nucleoside N-ribohydrolase
MFLDPLAAKTVLESSLDITLIPLSSQRKAASFQCILQALKHTDHTPESSFVHRLLLSLHDLQQKHELYHHMVNVFNSLYSSATTDLAKQENAEIFFSCHSINNSIMIHKSMLHYVTN